jgi:hypothetical protein
VSLGSDGFCVKLCVGQISPVKMPDAVHRVPTLEIAARLACALADAGVAETFDFASTRNGYKLDTGNGDDDEYRSE